MCICGMSQDEGGVCASLPLSLSLFTNWDSLFAIQERRTKLATPVKIEMIDKSFNIS